MTEIGETGRFRHLVTVQEKVGANDAYGQPASLWQEYAKAWCDVRPLTGKEFYDSMQQYAEHAYEFRTRHIAGKIIRPKMRILWGTRLFDIQSVANLRERNICSSSPRQRPYENSINRRGV